MLGRRLLQRVDNLLDARLFRRLGIQRQQLPRQPDDIWRKLSWRSLKQRS